MLTYFLYIAPAIVIGLLAQAAVKKSFATNSQIAVASGLSGAQVARQILDANGLLNVPVTATPGQLSDHYDPRTRSVHLSPEVHDGRSVASTAVAAHEVGHALQHQARYVPLQFRTAIFPVAQFASSAWVMLLLMGALLGVFGLVGLALLLYAVAVLFQIVTLPVEFNASRRAGKQLAALHLVAESESGGTKSVLRSAALTYVAAALSSIAVLLYYLQAFSSR